jgi:hypothetical protein
MRQQVGDLPASHVALVSKREAQNGLLTIGERARRDPGGGAHQKAQPLALLAEATAALVLQDRLALIPVVGVLADGLALADAPAPNPRAQSHWFVPPELPAAPDRGTPLPALDPVAGFWLTARSSVPLAFCVLILTPLALALRPASLAAAWRSHGGRLAGGGWRRMRRWCPSIGVRLRSSAFSPSSLPVLTNRGGQQDVARVVDVGTGNVYAKAPPMVS